jgi:hypothetical protein
MRVVQPCNQRGLRPKPPEDQDAFGSSVDTSPAGSGKTWSPSNVLLKKNLSRLQEYWGPGLTSVRYPSRLFIAITLKGVPLGSATAAILPTSRSRGPMSKLPPSCLVLATAASVSPTSK